MSDLLSPSVLALSPKSYEEQRKLRAQVIFDFLMETQSQMEGKEVRIDREELLLWLDALRSKYFFALVEAAPEAKFPYALKANAAGWFTTLNKGWSATRQVVLDNPMLTQVAFGTWRLGSMMDRALKAVGIEVVTEADYHEILPEELPPGGLGGA